MVLEALTALSLAGTIVQFVDFSGKLLAKGHEIYDSGDGASIGNSDIEAAAKNLRDLTGRLDASAVSRRGDAGSIDTSIVSEVALTQLTTKCSAVAGELLEVLDRLKVQGGSNRRWKSFRQALDGSLKQGRVDEINSRLQALRQELSFNVLVSFREDLDLQAIRSSAGFSALERSTRELAEKLLREQQMTFAVQTNILGIAQDRANTIVEAQNHQTRREIIETIQKERAGRLRRGGDEDEHPAKIKLISDLILESLRFQTLDDRYEEIEPAHKKTFGWIFNEPELEKPWADFPQWLSTGKGIYWINGKAASGKSTIMKYAFHDHRTQALLKSWAGRDRLIKVSHYFWNSGTTDQRSHAGLLRSLLYNVLNQCKSLIPDIFPEIWKDKSSKPLFLIEEVDAMSWTLPKLSQAFDRLLCTQSHGLKLCLFVDGLDEYDGDHLEIIGIFTRISESSNVKTCLSSRPLSDFVVAFKGCPSLRLQDLTFGDIQQYINHELGTNAHMQSLRESNPEVARSLVSEIVNKADGVFLWVKLVVLSLLRGLRQSDDIRDLQVRLKLLPPLLEDLFSHILGRLDPVYLEQSSRIFQIFAEAQKINDGSFTSVELSFAEELDSESVLRGQTRQLSAKELLERSCRVEVWLRTRCGGLIEPRSDGQSLDTSAPTKLSYLHRTVRDFLELPKIWSIVLKPTAGKEFVPSVALLQSQVLYIKWVLPFSTSLKWRIEDFQRSARRAVAFAGLAEAATKKPQMVMLDELDRVCTDLLRGFVNGSYSWTTETCIYDTSEADWTDMHQNSSLSLAVKSGLYFYVVERLKREPWLVASKGGRPLLQYAISEKNDLCSHSLQVKPDMIELLLSYGAQVGEVYESVSAWELVLESLFELVARGATKDTISKWLSIVKLFLEHGADPAQCLQNDPSKLAYSLVHALSEDPHEVKALLVSPGILAERAEVARRKQQAKEATQKKISVDKNNSVSNPSQLPLIKEQRSPQSPKVARQVARPAVVPNFSLWSIEPEIEMEEVPEGPHIFQESEGLIAVAPEASESNSQPSKNREPRTMSASAASQYQERVLPFPSQGWTAYSEVQGRMLHTIPNDQSLNLNPPQWIPHQPVSRQLELPPPRPPKIPILIETFYELPGSPVTAPSSQVLEGSQSAPQIFSSIAQPAFTSPTQWGERWREAQPTFHDSRGHLVPMNSSVLHSRPHSTQGISLAPGQSSQPTLFHHRSYNSLSYAQNVSSQASLNTQDEYPPYPRLPPTQQPYQPPPSESRNFSSSIYYSQQIPETSPQTLYMNRIDTAPDPYRRGPDPPNPYPQDPIRHSPLPRRPNPYPANESTQLSPSPIPSPRQHHQEFLSNPHQRPSPSQSPYSSPQFPGGEPRHVYSPQYVPHSAQYTGPEFQQPDRPLQNQNRIFPDQEMRAESVPVKDARPKSWIRRLTKSSRN